MVPFPFSRHVYDGFAPAKFAPDIVMPNARTLLKRKKPLDDTVSHDTAEIVLAANVPRVDEWLRLKDNVLASIVELDFLQHVRLLSIRLG